MEMTKKERILNYVKLNPEPDQDLCPELLQYWKGNLSYTLWSSKTGKRTDTLTSSRYDLYRRYGYGKLQSVNSYSHRGAYVAADGDMLVLAKVFIPGLRGKDGVKKTWSFVRGSRKFIFAHDPLVYDELGNPCWKTDQKKYNNTYVTKRFRDFQGDVWDETTTDILDRFLEENYGASVENKAPWRYAEFYTKEWTPRKRSTKAKAIEEYQMEPISDGLRLDVLDDKYAVLRICNNMNEILRVFVSAEGKVTIMVNDYGKWRLTPNRDYWSLGEMDITKEMYEVWNPLKWISPCIDWNSSNRYARSNANYVLKQTVTLLRHPIIEKLNKAGYPNVAGMIARDQKVANNIKTIFGTKEGKGNISDLGVNRHLLDVVEHAIEYDELRLRSGYGKVIAAMKETIGDLQHLSKESIDELFPGYVAMFAIGGNWKYNILGIGHGYGYGRVGCVLTEEQKHKVIWLCKKETKHPDFIRMFVDVGRMMDGLNNAPDIDIWSIENLQELSRAHDALVELKDYEKVRLEEERQKKFEKLNEKRIKRYEYEDDTYCIRVPRNLIDLVREGNSLGHCVGGYTTRVADGSTDILFLRKKSEPDMPFYTIEICNGRLIQIHGRYNKWLGNDPEAIPFVYEWLQQLEDVAFDVTMLLNKATGYCRGSELLDRSYLFRKEIVS